MHPAKIRPKNNWRRPPAIGTALHEVPAPRGRSAVQRLGRNAALHSRCPGAPGRALMPACPAARPCRLQTFFLVRFPSRARRRLRCSRGQGGVGPKRVGAARAATALWCPSMTNDQNCALKCRGRKVRVAAGASGSWVGERAKVPRCFKSRRTVVKKHMHGMHQSFDTCGASRCLLGPRRVGNAGLPVCTVQRVCRCGSGKRVAFPQCRTMGPPWGGSVKSCCGALAASSWSVKRCAPSLVTGPTMNPAFRCCPTGAQAACSTAVAREIPESCVSCSGKGYS